MFTVKCSLPACLFPSVLHDNKRNSSLQNHVKAKTFLFLFTVKVYCSFECLVNGFTCKSLTSLKQNYFKLT